MLGGRHAAFARRAAAPGADRVGETAAYPGVDGAPIMREAIAAIECTNDAEHSAGDHWIVVGRVRHLHLPAGGGPLVYWSGSFGRFERAP